MNDDIYDSVTKRWISVDLAYKRGFPSARFRLRANTHVFALPDKRKVSGFRLVAYTDKVDIRRAAKKAQQVFPVVAATIIGASQSLAPYREHDNWEYMQFAAPFRLALASGAADPKRPDRQIGEIQFMTGNVITHSDEVDFREFKSPAEWWNSETNDGSLRYNDSDGIRLKYQLLVETCDTIRIVFYRSVSPSIVGKSYNQQKFLDSIDEHCIFGEIIRYFESLVEDAATKSKATQTNRKSLLKKAKELLVLYKDGIPESDMETVAKRLDCAITIEDPNLFVIKTYNTKAKTKRFRYVFSRMDHGEYITVSLTDTPVIVSQEEAKEILAECLRNRTWCKYLGTVSTPKKVITPSNIYQVGTDLGDILYEFTKSFDRGMKIDAIAEPQLANFCKQGAKVLINWKHTNKKPTNEIDMKKAYTQFKHAPFYMGFPSIISMVAKVAPDHDIEAHPGIYEITIDKIPNASGSEEKSRGIKLARAYGFTEATFILTSPWILMLRSLGIVLHTNKGAFGKRFDFEFSPAMIESKAYQIFTGMQIHTEEDLLYKMHCDLEYAETLMSTSPQGHRMRYCPETSTLLMQQPKEYHGILPQIGSFIIAYTQLNVFKESLKYDPKDIVGTKLDSILLSCEPHDIGPLFVDIKTEDDWDGQIKMSSFTSPHVYEPRHADLPDYETPFVMSDYFISGPGGGGKTYKILNTPAFRHVVYATRAWKLVSEKVVEFKIKDIKIRGLSLNQLLGFDFHGEETQSYKDKFGSPPVIVGDELSMWSKEDVAKLNEMYPHSLILLAGDYGNGHYYQSSVVRPDQLYHPTSYIILDEDRRSINELTRAFKRVMRDLVDKGDLMEMKLFLLHRFKVEKLKDISYDKDFILTGTNARMHHYTKELLSEDESKNHWLVKRHNMSDVFAKYKGEAAYLHGELVDSPDMAPGRTEPRHAFTVHSFQGITIKEPKKCFIDIMNLGSVQDIYTAISRVENIDQIHLID
jgi:hypothetical protein